MVEVKEDLSEITITDFKGDGRSIIYWYKILRVETENGASVSPAVKNPPAQKAKFDPNVPYESITIGGQPVSRANAQSVQSAPPRKDIPTIAKAARGSIVSIVMSDKEGKPLGQGSGFAVGADGAIITNYHVIAEGVSAVAKFPDGAFYLMMV